MDERPSHANGPRNRPRRASRRALRIAAAAAGLVGFALPWGAIRAAPRPAAAAAPQVVYVPAGARVLIRGGRPGSSGVKVVSTGGASTTAPVAMTGASHPKP